MTTATRGSPSLQRLYKNKDLLTAVNRDLKAVLGITIEIVPLLEAQTRTSETAQDTGLVTIRVHSPDAPKTGYQLPDVGVGIAQSIPLLSATHATQSTLIIEEPEANLHPLAQTKLAESSPALSSDERKNWETQTNHQKRRRTKAQIEWEKTPKQPMAILETHWNTCQGFQQLIAEGVITDEDLQILYVEQEDGETVVRVLDTINGNLTEPSTKTSRTTLRCRVYFKSMYIQVDQFKPGIVLDANQASAMTKELRQF